MKYQDRVTVAILLFGVGAIAYLASKSPTEVAYIPPPTTPAPMPYVPAPPKITPPGQHYVPTPKTAYMTPNTYVPPRTAYAPPPRPNKIEVQVSDDGHGIFVRVAINGPSTNVIMQLDSGASHMIIPSWLARKLMIDGSITKADFVRYGIFTMADGSEHRQPIYRLHSITVSGFTVRDVLCSIGEDSSTLLLGKTFLDRFSSWAVDNNRHVLVLTN